MACLDTWQKIMMSPKIYKIGPPLFISFRSFQTINRGTKSRIVGEEGEHANNQCDQIAALCYQFWPFTTIKLSPIAIIWVIYNN